MVRDAAILDVTTMQQAEQPLSGGKYNDVIFLHISVGGASDSNVTSGFAAAAAAPSSSSSSSSSSSAPVLAGKPLSFIRTLLRAIMYHGFTARDHNSRCPCGMPDGRLSRLAAAARGGDDADDDADADGRDGAGADDSADRDEYAGAGAGAGAGASAGAGAGAEEYEDEDEDEKDSDEYVPTDNDEEDADGADGHRLQAQALARRGQVGAAPRRGGPQPLQRLPQPKMQRGKKRSRRQ